MSKSIETDNAHDFMALGDSYYYGVTKSQSYEKASRWYSEAAKRGHAASQTRLAYCYL